MKKWTFLSVGLLFGTNCFSGGMGAAESALMHDGIFLGLGANASSINVTQNSWGQGISDISTSTGSGTHGIAQGTGAPFYNTTNTLSPEIQAGYLKHFNGSSYLYGLKFSWQYLASTATNSNLYIPQLGQSISNTGTVSSLFGYVNGTSIQVTTNHELTLLAFLGQSFGNKYFYFGAGPSLVNMQSKNYYSIGYAQFEGVPVNITGLVSYSSPSLWIFGGAAQLGMTYFINPTWFLDLSYTYSRTGNTTAAHQQTFANASSLGTTTYNTLGILFTKDTLSLTSQTVALSINKIFDW